MTPACHSVDFWTFSLSKTLAAGGASGHDCFVLLLCIGPALCPFLHSATEADHLPTHSFCLCHPAAGPATCLTSLHYTAPCDCCARPAASPFTPEFSSLGSEAQFWCLFGGGDFSPLCSQDSYFLLLQMFCLSPWLPPRGYNGA